MDPSWVIFQKWYPRFYGSHQPPVPFDESYGNQGLNQLLKITNFHEKTLLKAVRVRRYGGIFFFAKWRRDWAEFFLIHWKWGFANRKQIQVDVPNSNWWWTARGFAPKLSNDFFSPAGPSICLDDILRGVNGTGDFQFQPLLGKSGFSLWILRSLDLTPKPRCLDSLSCISCIWSKGWWVKLQQKPPTITLWDWGVNSSHMFP